MPCSTDWEKNKKISIWREYNLYQSGWSTLGLILVFFSFPFCVFFLVILGITNFSNIVDCTGKFAHARTSEFDRRNLEAAGDPVCPNVTLFSSTDLLLMNPGKYQIEKRPPRTHPEHAHVKHLFEA